MHDPRRRRPPGNGGLSGRTTRGLFLGAVLVTASGCVTKRVWNWAGEGRYAFVPSRVTPLGLAREEGRSDRLFLRVDAESPAPAEEDASRDGEYYVLEIPGDWISLPRVVVPDDVQPGDLQLADLLETKLAPALSGATVASLRPIPLTPALPPLEAAPYAFVEGPPGILFVYGADSGHGKWIRLSSLVTGRVISTRAPMFNYAIAVIATPVTGAVDAVGVVVYAILWPFWSSIDIGYADSAGDGYRPDVRDQPGRERRELEKPRSRTDRPDEAPSEIP